MATATKHPVVERLEKDLDAVVRQIDQAEKRASEGRDKRNQLINRLVTHEEGPTVTDCAKRARVSHTMVSRIKRHGGKAPAGAHDYPIHNAKEGKK